jgi:ubiquinone/menaquinone biosynthesis C-methylase UbiE
MLTREVGEDLINGIKWDPTYRVIMDAGCGTGRVTKILAQKVGTKGTIYAVDVDPNMVNKAKLNLQVSRMYLLFNRISLMYSCLRK